MSPEVPGERDATWSSPPCRNAPRWATRSPRPGVDRLRFDRRGLDDKKAPGWIRAAVATGKPVFVATWAVKLPKLGVHGPILARSPGTSGDTGFVLMRVEP